MIRGVTLRSVVIFFILFNLVFSYYYMFKAGCILSIILLSINVFYMMIEILIAQKKIPKVKKCLQRFHIFYADLVLIILVFTLFLILIFSIINEPRHWYYGFPKECETYANSWARLGYMNQYRTNKIPSLTFRNVSDFDVTIDKYLMNKYEGRLPFFSVLSSEYKICANVINLCIKSFFFCCDFIR